MKKVTFLLVAVLVFGVANIVKAQDTDEASHSFGVKINPTALVDIEGVTAFTLEPVVGTEAGAQPFSFEGVKNDAHWLNYTSVKDADNETRSITAELSYEGTTLPAGMSIVLTPDAATSGGNGNKGTVNETAITLDQNAEGGHTIVSGIGSCYTGNGTNAGVNLVYSLKLNENNFGTIEADTYTATVTYTISDL
ncbi:hypothetical protein SAMN05444285_10215 [Draconibacterium orientale]|uniref:WxL domain-containing protein n=1 Tax=Draconibacterium orientale TaxID=1168034 RepID=X5DFY4_9BACT|nr:hypothetical protein [Draconibacterium orientale]AHW61843.1 hypothetical protein FH5T_09405 [Draconibacterium orientale]SES76428.1 hypothetical protein SAMN05444285_10215 [Draconibacterium orientale]